LCYAIKGQIEAEHLAKFACEPAARWPRGMFAATMERIRNKNVRARRPLVLAGTAVGWGCIPTLTFHPFAKRLILECCAPSPGTRHVVHADS
jgi:hypothetical protein